MPPFVSIVIPAYNRAVKLTEAVKSLQAQTYKDWEALVVDDGSRDNTIDVAQQLAAGDSRIRLIKHERNKGAQAARNTGIKAAQGEWIAFLDSDDQWLPDSLELRLKHVQNNGVAVVHSQAYIQHPGKPLELYYLPSWNGWIYRKILTREGPVFPSLLVKKEALAKIGYLDENIVAFQEWDTSIRLAKFFQFAFEPKPTFIYDYTCPDSISRDLIRGAKGYGQIVHKNFWNILVLGGPGIVGYHYGVMANGYRDGGDSKNARKYLIKSFIWKLFSPTITARRIKGVVKGKKGDAYGT